MLKKLTAHPASVGETYWQHMGMALGFSARMMAGALVALVHAFLPCLFEKTGSRMIENLYRRMTLQRQSASAIANIAPNHLTRS